MPFSESQPRQEGKEGKPRDTILVATHDGQPNKKIEEVLANSSSAGSPIEWINSNDIPEEPPEHVKTLMLNAGDRPKGDSYDKEGVHVTRLTWLTNGDFAGWSRK